MQLEFKKVRFKRSNDPQTRWLIIAVAMAAPLISAFVAAYVHFENPAYVWDYGAYWEYFKTYAHLISSGANGWPTQLGREIETLDYNPLASVLLYPVYLIGGETRTAYVIGICLVYLLPAAFVFSLLSKQVVPRANAVLVFIMVLTYIPFWTPSLRGMVDIVGLIPLGLATLVLLRTNFLSRNALYNSLLLGILIYLPFLFRRWYAFSIVSFMALAFLFVMIQRLREGKSMPRAVMAAAFLLGLAGIVASVLVLLIQFDLVERILTTNYSELHAGWQTDFKSHMMLFPGFLGWYFISAIVLGVGLSFITLNPGAIFCTLAATLTFLLFIRVQTLAFHHFLPIAAWLLVPYVVATERLGRQLTRLPEVVRMGPFVAAGLAVFILSIVPGLNKGGNYIEGLVPKSSSFPLHLDNYSEYERLVGDLDRMLDSNAKIVCFCYSFEMADAMLVALDPALLPRVSYVSYTPTVTLITPDNLRAEYALVRSDPGRRTVPPTWQHLSIPAEMILSQTGIGSGFEKLGTYNLSGGQTADLFRRTRPVTKPEVVNLINELGASYHKDFWPQFKKTMALPFALRQDRLGDVYGTSYPAADETTLLMRPGLKMPSSTTIPMDPALTDLHGGVVLSISDTVSASCLASDGADVSLTFNDTPIWQGEINPGGSTEVELPKETGNLSILVDKQGDTDCGHLTVRFEKMS
ncbi:DUF3488 domain-containing protein [Candidatus Phyllobacterium onerii]|uniref:DUF3488 domain-containing protein n=1 Tax=Candidatus Phyllobacterium onerii TaxID=3020828 RepID=UPI00232D50B3|nr:hypothetical protein [Phyllobacterium sp. IY22]